MHRRTRSGLCNVENAKALSYRVLREQLTVLHGLRLSDVHDLQAGGDALECILLLDDPALLKLLLKHDKWYAHEVLPAVASLTLGKTDDGGLYGHFGNACTSFTLEPFPLHVHVCGQWTQLALINEDDMLLLDEDDVYVGWNGAMIPNSCVPRNAVMFVD